MNVLVDKLIEQIYFDNFLKFKTQNVYMDDQKFWINCQISDVSYIVQPLHFKNKRFVAVTFNL